MQEKKEKTLAGVVIGKSGQKTIKVAVDYMVKHPKYGKYLRRRTRLAVHDELNQAGVDDKVEITESRPYSKTKSWRLVQVLQKAAKE
jgi:small subunit ribosomal protein S17